MQPAWWQPHCCLFYNDCNRWGQNQNGKMSKNLLHECNTNMSQVKQGLLLGVTGKAGKSSLNRKSQLAVEAEIGKWSVTAICSQASKILLCSFFSLPLFPSIDIHQTAIGFLLASWCLVNWQETGESLCPESLLNCMKTGFMLHVNCVNPVSF